MNISGNYIVAHLTGKQVLVAKQNQSDKPSDQEQLAVQKLKNRDQEVRQHEARHMSNPDLQTVGGPHYTYTVGPDGKLYATGGRVSISTGAVKDPDDAIRKARALQNASLSVGEPSTQDLAAAGAAKAMEMEAVVKKSGEETPDSEQNNKGNNIKPARTPIDIYA